MYCRYISVASKLVPFLSLSDLTPSKRERFRCGDTVVLLTGIPSLTIGLGKKNYQGGMSTYNLTLKQKGFLQTKGHSVVLVSHVFFADQEISSFA